MTTPLAVFHPASKFNTRPGRRCDVPRDPLPQNLHYLRFHPIATRGARVSCLGRQLSDLVLSACCKNLFQQSFLAFRMALLNIRRASLDAAGVVVFPASLALVLSSARLSPPIATFDLVQARGFLACSSRTDSMVSLMWAASLSISALLSS